MLAVRIGAVLFLKGIQRKKKKAPKCLVLSVTSDQVSTFYKKHFFSQLCLLVGLGSGALLVGPRSAEPFPVCASAGMLDLLSLVC